MSPRRSSAAVALALAYLSATGVSRGADPTRRSDEAAYVVQERAVHVVSSSDLERLRAARCRPAPGASWYRAPPFVSEHCHGRVFVGARAIRWVDTNPGESAMDLAAAGGISRWAYAPAVAEVLLEGELGGGTDGLVSAFAFRESFGLGFLGLSPPGPNLRLGFNVLWRGAPGLRHGRLELPTADLGWVFSSGQVISEAGVHSGLMLDGYLQAGDMERDLGFSVPWGAYGVMSRRGEVLRVLWRAELLRLGAEPAYEYDMRACIGTALLLGCTRMEHRWLAADGGPGRAFDAVGRSSIVGIDLAIDVH